MAIVVTTLFVLVLICVATQWIASNTKSQLTGSLNADFRKFQKVFFVPYLLALFSDWLQGPYVYRLYSQYGYAPEQIALLYICELRYTHVYIYIFFSSLDLLFVLQVGLDPVYSLVRLQGH